MKLICTKTTFFDQNIDLDPPTAKPSEIKRRNPTQHYTVCKNIEGWKESTDLSLDFVNWALRVLDIGLECVGDAAGVPNDGDCVGEERHEREEGEDGGVHEAGGGAEAEPVVDHQEHGRVVEIGDG